MTAQSPPSYVATNAEKSPKVPSPHPPLGGQHSMSVSLSHVAMLDYNRSFRNASEMSSETNQRCLLSMQTPFLGMNSSCRTALAVNDKHRMRRRTTGCVEEPLATAAAVDATAFDVVQCSCCRCSKVNHDPRLTRRRLSLCRFKVFLISFVG